MLTLPKPKHNKLRNQVYQIPGCKNFGTRSQAVKWFKTRSASENQEYFQKIEGLAIGFVLRIGRHYNNLSRKFDLAARSSSSVASTQSHDDVDLPQLKQNIPVCH